MIPFYTNDAMKKNTIEVIKHARHLIDEYGWVQCKSGDRETGFCLTGACIEALEELRVVEVYQPVIKALSANLVDQKAEVVRAEDESLVVYTARQRATALQRYNDATNRTSEEIFALFDDALERLTEDG